jgi:pyruvate/2-oxoglutarate dehydrogenase complex dihydrolipoamide dehydrogenase (E3) component
MAQLEADVCIIGGGSAGLSIAAGTSQLGLKTALVERDKMGGECLNYGCVPSKALLAAAKAAHNCDLSDFTGISGTTPKVEFGGVKDGIDDIVATIAPNDSVERFERLGVRVLKAQAAFSDPHTVQIGGDSVRARRIVIATGSTATIPDIPGLDAGKVLTNETIFSLRERPAHLVVLGAGPVGLEMAFAYRRLGIPVTIIDQSAVLPREEPEHVEVLRQILHREKIDTLENREVVSIAHEPGNVAVTIRNEFGTSIVAGSHLLVAAGRTPRLTGLGLEAAGVASTAKGIVVDRRLRTTQRHVFALGDVIDGPRYTHAAGYQAGIVVRNLAFRLPAKVDYRAMPRTLYTDPELAHVGLTEAEARHRHGDRVGVETAALGQNDRAVAERRRAGSIKVIVGPGGRVLGASILAPSAGEMIGLWCLIIRQRLGLRAIADLTLPYPTMSEIGRAAAGHHYQDLLFSKWTRRLVQMLQMAPGW